MALFGPTLFHSFQLGGGEELQIRGGMVSDGRSEVSLSSKAHAIAGAAPLLGLICEASILGPGRMPSALYLHVLGLPRGTLPSGGGGGS